MTHAIHVVCGVKYVTATSPAVSSKHATFNQCWVMLGQRRRRWPNIECTMFAGYRSLQAQHIGPALV